MCEWNPRSSTVPEYLQTCVGFLETRGDEQARDSIMIPAEDDHDVLCRRPGVIALPEVFTFHRPLIQLQWVQGG